MLQYFQSVKKHKKNGITLLDNAATAQLPDSVIHAISQFYANDNFPAGNPSYSQSEQVAQKVKECRAKVLAFLSAGQNFDVVFSQNASDAVCLIVNNLLRPEATSSGSVLLSNFEHDSVYHPIRKLSEGKGFYIEFLDLLVDKGEAQINKIVQTYKFAFLTLSSNVIGKLWEDDFSDLISLVAQLKGQGTIVIVDACQEVAHRKIDLAKLGADFLFFSAHKMGGPHGIGVLVGRKKLLDQMSKEGTLEAGSPNVAQIIGLSAALDFYNQNIDFKASEKRLVELSKSLTYFLSKSGSVRVLPSVVKGLDSATSIISFVPHNIPLHDFSWVLAQNGVLTRSGKMCSDLANQALGINGCVRISLMHYNDEDDVKNFVLAFNKTVEFFQGKL